MFISYVNVQQLEENSNQTVYVLLAKFQKYNPQLYTRKGKFTMSFMVE